jgi:ATP-dependent Lon protease
MVKEFFHKDVDDKYIELADTKRQLLEQLKSTPKNKILLSAVNECRKSISKLVKRSRNKNAKSYHKLINNDKKHTNEIEYFKKKMSNQEQIRVMKELQEINTHINIDKPYRLALLDANIPAKYKAVAMQKLNVLRTMEPGDSEYYKIKQWVDGFMRVPYGKYMDLSIKIEDGIDKCSEFMEASMRTLDECVFGLNDAKLQIMQMLGQWITNPTALGSAIAIKGPMGTGKTTLVKEGISKILGREFTFIALGGTGDSSFLEGHSYTYEGSSWGKIVQILIDSKCMNPVIYFDELDKVSDTPRGEEIIGILTHLTDTSQNSEFHDKYFSELNFDLSKCLFIFSYNDESKINPILRDRMYCIQTKGYDLKEKIIIVKQHLIPKIREQVKFTENDVIISDEVLDYIASNQSFTKSESGVRNLKRCLEIIYTKLNLFRLVNPDTTKIFNSNMDIEVKFPFTVTKHHVDMFIKGEDGISQSMMAMYV